MEEDLRILEELVSAYGKLDCRFGNMLSCKQSNAIDHLVQAYKDQQSEIKLLKDQKQYVIDQYGRTIDEQQEELENKDKIIDEMVKVIIDSSICDYFIKQNCKHYAGENKKTCDDCIKQYFERKVNSNE